MSATAHTEPCPSCPFIRDNFEAFNAFAAKLCEKFAKPKPNFWMCMSIRQRLIDDAVSHGRLQCHKTVYDAKMNAHPETSQPCAGLARHLATKTS
jgi:hypothetical protein